VLEVESSRKAVSNVLLERGLSLNIIEKCSAMILFTLSLSENSCRRGDIINLSIIVRVSIVQLLKFCT
jgi:hypothetical protein